jgi:hypothetical protein
MKTKKQEIKTQFSTKIVGKRQKTKKNRLSDNAHLKQLRPHLVQKMIPIPNIFAHAKIEYLGVPLRVGLFAAILCLSGQRISAAIPNAKLERFGNK